MSLTERLRPSEKGRRRVVSVLFGDRRGLVLFLVGLALLTLVTRLGIFITDTYTTANAFVALTEGQLHIDEAFYGTSLDTPGVEIVDGKAYGRNYGQLVASLPAYGLLVVLSAVVDLQISIVAGWSLLVLAIFHQVGTFTSYDSEFAIGGSVLAVVVFFLNAAVATPIDPQLTHVLAMQLTGVVAGACLAVVTYRLLKLVRSPRLGVLGGVIILIGTPVGFWAPIPKRHIFTTLLILTAIYALAASRVESTPRRRRALLHGGAYASAGLLAWVHAPEGLILLFSLVIADLPVVPSLDRRRFGTVVGVFTLSLLPFFATNLMITGDPFIAPRMLKRVEAVVAIAPVAIADGPARAGLFGGTAWALAAPIIDDAITATQVFTDLLYKGLLVIWYEPERVYHTVVRSGYIADTSQTGEQAINLSLAESAPLLAGAVVLPGLAIEKARRINRQVFSGSKGAALLGFGTFSLLLFVVYIDRLPLHAQVTVRYLLPLFAVGVIVTLWLTPVGRALEAHTRTFCWVLAASVFVGGQILLVVVVQLDLALGEAFQFHALLGLAMAGLLLGWTVLATFSERFDRTGAGLIAVAVATSILFSLFVVTAYTDGIGVYPLGGKQALPLLRVISDIVTTA